ncbi:MAG: hypothetical protein ACK443_12255, partial [Methylococcaceae bacterium]
MARVKLYYDSISSLTLKAGSNSSYQSGTAFYFDFSPGPAWTGTTISKNTPTPAITYSETSFQEAADNDGGILQTAIITLLNGVFTGTNGQILPGVSVTNIPAGLSAVITRTSDTTATLGFTGTAVAHANANDVNDLTITFADAAFTSGNASAVTGAERRDLSIDFVDRAIAINDITVNENSPTAVWTVIGTAGQPVSLSLGGTATGTGTDYGAADSSNLQYSLDNGLNWLDYTGAITT